MNLGMNILINSHYIYLLMLKLLQAKAILSNLFTVINSDLLVSLYSAIRWGVII